MENRVQVIPHRDDQAERDVFGWQALLVYECLLHMHSFLCKDIEDYMDIVLCTNK